MNSSEYFCIFHHFFNSIGINERLDGDDDDDDLLYKDIFLALLRLQ